MFMFKARVFLDDFCCELYNGFSFWEFADCDFVRSGLVGLKLGSISGSGNQNFTWSRTANQLSSSTQNACGLYFSATGVTANRDNFYRWYGFPVRCLVILVRIISNDITRLRVPAA